MKLGKPSDTSSSSAPEFFSAEVSVARRFYLDLKPGGKRNLSVVCGGLERSSPTYSIHRETFPFFSIEYVVRGSGKLLLKGNDVPLGPGSLFSYGPGVPHRITGNPDDPLEKYFVDFTGTGAAALLRTCGLHAGTAAKVFPPDALQPLFEELILAGLSIHSGSPELCAKLLECLALRIAGSHAPAEGADSHAFATYQQCRLYISQHFLRLRTLEEIAAECHVNNAYLCRLFRRYDKQTPYQYLRRLKMNHAAERLQQPGVMVKQVALESGFPDPFHFSRVFTSVFGIPPGEFRRLR